MAEIKLKYFKDADTISSTDYNSNVDEFNNGTISIDASNVRDQGLDVYNFKDETAVLDKYNTQVSREKIEFRVKGDILPTQQTLVVEPFAYKTNLLNLGTILDTTASPVAVKDEPKSIFRCNFEYLIDLLGTEDTITDLHSFLRFKVEFFLECTNENGVTFNKFLPQLSRQVQYTGRQLAMLQGYGNIGISSVIDRKSIDPSGQSRIFTNFSIKPVFSLKSNDHTQANCLFASASTFWDSRPSDEKVSLTIANYIANLTVYPRV